MITIMVFLVLGGMIVLIDKTVEGIGKIICDFLTKLQQKDK
jgi:hypothetical protein